VRRKKKDCRRRKKIFSTARRGGEKRKRLNLMSISIGQHRVQIREKGGARQRHSARRQQIQLQKSIEESPGKKNFARVGGRTPACRRETAGEKSGGRSDMLSNYRVRKKSDGRSSVFNERGKRRYPGWSIRGTGHRTGGRDRIARPMPRDQQVPAGRRLGQAITAERIKGGNGGPVGVKGVAGAQRAKNAGARGGTVF